MKVSLERLTLKGFKNYVEEKVVEFGDITKITGRNGEGKSSIGEAVSWVLFGKDLMGSTLDPTNEFTRDDVRVDLELEVDGKLVKLTRELVSGKSKYYVNDVPEKATEFKKIVESIFSETFFLTLFNPLFFFSQHWQKQREQLLQYVKEPLNKEVLAVMNNVERKYLEERIKEMPLDKLERKYRDIFNTKDKELTRLMERVKTLKEQVDIDTDFDKDAAEKELAEIMEKINQADSINAKISEAQLRKRSLEQDIERIKNHIQRYKNQIEKLKNEPIEENCKACGQKLQDEAIQKVKEWKERQIAELKAEAQEVLKEYKAKLAELETIKVPGERVSVAELQEKAMELRAKLDDFIRAQKSKEAIENSMKEAEETRKERNEALGVVEAIKTFKAKKAELMAEKVNGLFKNLSVKLFETQKNGEERPTFEVEYQGKPFSKLSTAERVKAGIELIEGISQVADVNIPVFVDNSESIVNLEVPERQLIIAKVVDEPLKITTQKLEEVA